MATVKLAEALLRRKGLQQKVDQLRAINVENLFVTRAKRVMAAEGIDDVTAKVPRLTLAQVTAAFDWHARRLRMIDAAIQQANWNTAIDVDDSTMTDYVEPDPNA